MKWFGPRSHNTEARYTRARMEASFEKIFELLKFARVKIESKVFVKRHMLVAGVGKAWNDMCLSLG